MPLQCDLCTDDDVNVGMYQDKFEGRAHVEFVLAGNSEVHTGSNFDEDPHEELGRPEKLCGAQQARTIPDAELKSLTWSEWGMSVVVVFL